MRVPDFPVYETYDEILKHARKVVAKAFKVHVRDMEDDDMFYTGFVRGDLSDAMFGEDAEYQHAVDIVKSNPEILLAEVLEAPSNLESFIFAAIAETVIQDLHKEFQSKAIELYEAAEAKREAEAEAAPRI